MRHRTCSQRLLVQVDPADLDNLVTLMDRATHLEREHMHNVVRLQQVIIGCL